LGAGFFEGWPRKPSREQHWTLLEGSPVKALAVDEATGNIIGFATGLTDGVLTGFIPLLEVLPKYRGRGIGRRLIEMVMDQMSDCYSIDLVCDTSLETFYQSLGFETGPKAMIMRRRENIEDGSDF
jgi:ribosomal protein S18 acetylase RimI-like enzyme